MCKNTKGWNSQWLISFYAEDIHSIYTFHIFFSFISIFESLLSAWFTLAVEESAVIYFEFLLCLKNNLLFPLKWRSFFLTIKFEVLELLV